MDSDRVFLVIILTIVIVIGINGILYLALRRGNEANFIDLTRKSMMNVRNPWESEDQALQELARLVADLNSPENIPPPDRPVDDKLSQPVSKDTHGQ